MQTREQRIKDRKTAWLERFRAIGFSDASIAVLAKLDAWQLAILLDQTIAYGDRVSAECAKLYR